MCLLLDIAPHLPEYENRTRFCAENGDQVTLAALAAIAVLLKERTPARIVAAGLFCGLSACFTQTRGLAVAAGFVVFFWWESREKQEGWRRILRNEAQLLAGFLVAFLTVNAYFLFAAGPARYFWCTVIFVLKYYPKEANVNTFQALTGGFPEFFSLRTFLDSFARWLILFALTPLVFILFFAFYWRMRSRNPWSIGHARCW